jgi:hypothetical protein
MLTLHSREGVCNEDYVLQVTGALSVSAHENVEVDYITVELLVVYALVLT